MAIEAFLIKGVAREVVAAIVARRDVRPFHSHFELAG
jgi:hypothetical protein